MTYELHHGDCLDILPTLAAGSVDAVICDPPYGTTGHACANTGRNFIGIERDPHYFAIASERIAGAYAPLAAMERAS